MTNQNQKVEDAVVKDIPVPEKTKRTRLVPANHKLSDDAAVNIKGYATWKLNIALAAIDDLAECTGKNFAWTPEQIAKVEDALATHCLTCTEGLGKARETVVNQVSL